MAIQFDARIIIERQFRWQPFQNVERVPVGMIHGIESDEDMALWEEFVSRVKEAESWLGDALHTLSMEE